MKKIAILAIALASLGAMSACSGRTQENAENNGATIENVNGAEEVVDGSETIVGEEAIFAMPAADLFNGGQKQFGLNDESIVLVTISTNPAGAAKPDSVAAKPAAVKPAAK